MGRSRQDAGAKLMGHTMLRKNLVRNVESASIPQFLNESFDDVLGWLHWRVPRLANSILYVCQLVINQLHSESIGAQLRGKPLLHGERRRRRHILPFDQQLPI